MPRCDHSALPAADRASGRSDPAVLIRGCIAIDRNFTSPRQLCGNQSPRVPFSRVLFGDAPVRHERCLLCCRPSIFWRVIYETDLLFRGK
jgi:hypothetical protein